MKTRKKRVCSSKTSPSRESDAQKRETNSNQKKGILGKEREVSEGRVGEGERETDPKGIYDMRSLKISKELLTYRKQKS